MAEGKKEPWLNYLALTTVIFAVCATLSTFKGGGFSTRSVLNQFHAANQWAYYQAKSIKGYLYELQKEKLELELKAMGSRVPKPVVEEYEKRIEYYSKNIKRYDEEKTRLGTRPHHGCYWHRLFCERFLAFHKIDFRSVSLRRRCTLANNLIMAAGWV